MTELASGTRLGDYTIEKLLGAGGMGAVYLARSPSRGEVALKVMHAQAALDEHVRRRFLREARVTTALDHPNVVRILESFEHHGKPVIVMEVLHGQSLTSVLEREPKQPLARISALFARVVSAVGTAHAMGLVHRDLKPDNIFLIDGEPFVKVLDFGIAKLRKGFGLEESSALTKTGMLLGTPYYMSPEQAFGEKTIDHRADLWSLGLILYEGLAGILPTRADTLHEVLKRVLAADFERLDRVDPAIPRDVADLVASMLQRERDARPGDLREVFHVLSRHAGALEKAPASFAAPAAPVFADEPSAQTIAAPSVSPAAESVPSPQLKMTPQSLKKSGGGATPEGTLILAGSKAPPPRGTLPGSSSSPAASQQVAPTLQLEGGARVAAGEVPARSRSWMWIVAAVLVLGCIVVLVTQFT